jgi:hypothetical protein
VNWYDMGVVLRPLPLLVLALLSWEGVGGWNFVSNPFSRLLTSRMRWESWPGGVHGAAAGTGAYWSGAVV